MNYFPWSIDLRIPFPPSHPLKKVYLLEAPHLQVADMGTKYSGQLSVEQRKNTHVQTKCGYAQTGYVKPCLLALKNTLQLLCSFSLFTNATDQAHNMIYFFFFLFNAPSACDLRQGFPLHSGPRWSHLVWFWSICSTLRGPACSLGVLLETLQLWAAYYAARQKWGNKTVTIPEVVGNSGTELPIKTQLFTAEKCALSWDTWGWTVSPD